MMFRRVEIIIIALSFVIIPIVFCAGAYLFSKCKQNCSDREKVEKKSDSLPSYEGLFGRKPFTLSV